MLITCNAKNARIQEMDKLMEYTMSFILSGDISVIIKNGRLTTPEKFP